MGPKLSLTVFLKGVGLPVHRQLEGGGASTDVCELCALRPAAFRKQTCPKHTCHCRICRKDGSLLGCKWRQRLRTCLRPKSFKRNQVKFLNKAKAAMKQPTLQKVPDYFELAARQSLATSKIKSPRERCLLNLLSQMHCLMLDGVVIDLSQSFHRARYRVDGCTPTLTAQCSRLYLPACAHFLSAAQCLALQGIEANMLAGAGLTLAEQFKLAGNAISVPVLRALVAAILGELGRMRVASCN